MDARRYAFTPALVGTNPFIHRLVAGILGVLILIGGAQAQLPDADSLRRALNQGKSLTSSPVETPSALDLSRQLKGNQTNDKIGPEGEQPFPVEEPLSPLEMDYNRRLGRDLPGEIESEETRAKNQRRKRLEQAQLQTQASLRPMTELELEQLEEMRAAKEREKAPPMLRQFGYDLFRDSLAASDMPVTGRLSDSYILGVGDEIVVTMVGQSGGTIVTGVDREGRIILPDLAPIPAAGRSFGDFARDVRQRVAQSLLGTEAYVSIGALRQVSVTVMGEVDYPGQYQATSQSDLLQLMALAGGIKKSGSLRRLTVFRDGQRLEIDLYDVFFGTGDISLQVRDGDRLLVPLIGPTVAVAGDVVRPAIYELPANQIKRADQEIAVAEVLQLAGGSLRPRGYSIDRNRIGNDGYQNFTSTSATDRVAAGDLYQVYPQRQVHLGRVQLLGHVRQPGYKPLSAAPTISALLKGGDALKMAPYSLFAIVETIDDLSQQLVYKPVDLGPILAGTEDVVLRDQDSLLILGPHELDYLSSEAVRSAVLAPQSVTPDQCDAVVSLARRARQADSERLAAAARSVFIVEEDRQQQEQQQQQQQQQLQQGQQTQLGAVGQNGSRNQDNSAVQRASDFSSDEIVSASELARLAAQAAQCNEFFDERPEILPLAIEYAVVMMGAVRQPGLYPIAGSASLRDLVAASGGLSLSADPEQIEISSIRNRELAALGATERRYVDLRSASLASIDVTPGSTIRFASQQATMEAGTVLLSGEFKRPGVYTIKRGETLLQVMTRAGGLTDQAYPFGSVFTRMRVKQEQQEGFRRTARELNNALALAMLRENISGDALTAANSLVNSFATVEAAGRVVVEADPQILRQNPERDLVLETGDSIFIPKRPNFVLTAGDLLNPGALQFRSGKSIEDYLDEAGGFQETADKNRVFIVFPNGVAQRFHSRVGRAIHPWFPRVALLWCQRMSIPSKRSISCGKFPMS